MLSEHSYRGLLLRSLSSRSDWTHGADRGHHILQLQTTEHAEIANYSKYFDNNMYNVQFLISYDFLLSEAHEGHELVTDLIS